MASYLYYLSEHPLSFLPSASILHGVGAHLLESSTQDSVVLWTALQEEVLYRQIQSLEIWFIGWNLDMWLCWTETKEQDQKTGKEMGKNKMAPKLPSPSKILQWFPMDNSICITHTGTQLLFCIIIVHTLAVPHLQLILETPYAPARQKHLNLPLLIFMPGICYTLRL